MTSPIQTRGADLLGDGPNMPPIPFGYARLWQLGLASVGAGVAPGCRHSIKHADQLRTQRARALRALRCDSVATLAAARLEGCLVAPCGSAACPLCVTVIDPFLLGRCDAAVGAAAHPWLVLWAFVPAERGEAGLATLQPDRIRAALAGHLAAAGVVNQRWLGRVALKADLAEPARREVNYTVAIGAVTNAPTGVDLEARLRAHRGPDAQLHLWQARALTAGDAAARMEAVAYLDGTFDSAADNLILSVPNVDGRPPGRGERRARRGLVERAETAMARHWSRLDYADLLIGDAAHEIASILADR